MSSLLPSSLHPHLPPVSLQVLTIPVPMLGSFPVLSKEAEDVTFGDHLQLL